jgi:hypothetical protein
VQQRSAVRSWPSGPGRQVLAVTAVLPRFLTAPLFRRRHRTWGATDEEVAAAMPGDVWYADDLLDNFARPSTRELVPVLQDLHLGQWLAMVPRPTERTAFVVDGFVVPEWLLWRTPNRTPATSGPAPGCWSRCS